VRQRRAGGADGACEGADAGLSIAAAILGNDRLGLPVELPDCPAEPQGEAQGQQVDQDGVEDDEQLRWRKDIRGVMAFSGSAVETVALSTATILLA